MRLFCKFAALMLLSGVVATAEARDIFVNNITGTDRYSGRAETAQDSSGPTRSIGRAIELADFGDRIIIAKTSAPYRECITLQGRRSSGSRYTPFTIIGNGAILDGSAKIPADAWQPFGNDTFRFSPQVSRNQVIYRDGAPLPKRTLYSKWELDSLKPGHWAALGRDIFFRVEKGKLPNDYELSYAKHPVGVTLYEVHDVLIEDLVVQGFRLDGINAHDNAFECRIVGATGRGNGRSGISIGGASRIGIANCTFGDNGVAQVRTEGWSTAFVNKSELLPYSAPAWVVAGGRLIVDGSRKYESALPFVGPAIDDEQGNPFVEDVEAESPFVPDVEDAPAGDVGDEI